MAGQFHAPSHPGVLNNLNMNGIYFRDILLTRISRGANNCGQHPLEKNIYFIMRFSPHFQLFYFNDRLEFCKFFEGKIKRINNADLFSQLPLLIFIKGANISGGHCIYIYNFFFFFAFLFAQIAKKNSMIVFSFLSKREREKNIENGNSSERRFIVTSTAAVLETVSNPAPGGPTSCSFTPTSSKTLA